VTGACTESTNLNVTPRACPQFSSTRTVKGVLVSAIEEVVGRVGHRLSLAYRAGGRRNSSSRGIQALNEGGFEQEVPAGGPLLVPYGLQLEALNPTGIRATRDALTD